MHMSQNVYLHAGDTFHSLTFNVFKVYNYDQNSITIYNNIQFTCVADFTWVADYFAKPSTNKEVQCIQGR